MTRNEKLSELLSNKLITNEKCYLIGDDFHLEGTIRFVNNYSNSVSIETSIGTLRVHYDKINTII